MHFCLLGLVGLWLLICHYCGSCSGILVPDVASLGVRPTYFHSSAERGTFSMRRVIEQDPPKELCCDDRALSGERGVVGLLFAHPCFFAISSFSGRRIFIHHQCWEVLRFCRFQRQRCTKVRVLRSQDFHTPLALKTAKGQHLPALVVYTNQSPI